MGARSVVKKVVPKGVFKKIEPYGHLGEAVLFNAKNSFPAKGLKVIGVTGTNGKTSTCFLIHKMLTKAGYKSGLLTTAAYGVGDDLHPQTAHMTTLPVPMLHRRIKQFKSQGIEWLVLEVTSHALAQHRVWGVPFSVAVFTNLSHEHLDYHGTFEKYRDAKRQLFTLTDRNHSGLRIGIVNADDQHGSFFADAVAHPVSYGMQKGDLRATGVKLSASGSQYVAKIGDEQYRITCHLAGSFSVYNSLAAVGVGRAVGLTKQQIEQGIAALKSVDGRMDVVDEGQDFQVIVDYAHTPDSFEKLFKDFRPVVKGKLIVLTGSAGRRDAEKRPIQVELAGKYADEVILTEDDTRDEDLSQIMSELATGATKAGKKLGKDLFLIDDRTEAINFAVSRAKKGDVILLLGKGHEKKMLRGGPKAAQLRHLQQDDTNPDRVVKDPWDEQAIARQAIRARRRKTPRK